MSIEMIRVSKNISISRFFLFFSFYRQLYLYRKHLMFRNAIIRVGSLNDERYFYPRDQPSVPPLEKS